MLVAIVHVPNVNVILVSNIVDAVLAVIVQLDGNVGNVEFYGGRWLQHIPCYVIIF